MGLREFHITKTNGVRIKDIYPPESDTLIIEKEWLPGTINKTDISSSKTYEILYTYENELLYVKPAKKYLCRVFEEIFGFGYNCENYSPDKVINMRI